MLVDEQVNFDEVIDWILLIMNDVVLVDRLIWINWVGDFGVFDFDCVMVLIMVIIELVQNVIEYVFDLVVEGFVMI